MLRSIDLANVSFGEPDVLWLLAVPGLLLVFWTWRLLRRRADRIRLREGRTVPIRERLQASTHSLFVCRVVHATVSDRHPMVYSAGKFFDGGALPPLG